jgi:hypothetical protein
VYCLSSDPCGSIPTAVVNKANVKQPLCIAAVRKLIQQTPGMIQKVLEQSATEAAHHRAPEPSPSSHTVSHQQERKVAPATSSSSSAAAPTAAAAAPVANGGAAPQAAPQVDPFGFVIAPLPPCKHDAALQVAYDNSMKAFEGRAEDGWVFKSRLRDVDISSRADPSGSGSMFLRGSGDVPFDGFTFARVFVDREYKKQWDDMYSDGKTLEITDMWTCTLLSILVIEHLI